MKTKKKMGIRTQTRMKPKIMKKKDRDDDEGGKEDKEVDEGNEDVVVMAALCTVQPLSWHLPLIRLV